MKTFSNLGKTIFLALTATLLNVFPECAGCTYDDPERNAQFANKYCPGSRIEAAAGVFSTYEQNGKPIYTDLLLPHTDPWNDSTKPSYGAVLGKSVLVRDHVRNTVDRCGAVAYGKHAALQYLERLHRYQDILRRVYKVWEELPTIEKEVDQSLFPDLLREPDGKYLANPHTQKTVYYSSFRHVIRLFLEEYKVLASQPLLLAGLLFCVTVSPAPQHFYYELKRVIEEPGIFAKRGHSSVADMDGREFTRCFYDHLFDAKRHKQSYRTVNRHQPCHNNKATDTQLQNSLDVIARLLYELNRVPADDMSRDIAYYHARALAILRQSCPQERVNVWEGPNTAGVYAAGSLTAQHILGVAVGVGAAPDCLLTHAEIASGTSSWAFLASFGLEEDKFAEHSENILAAISHYLGIHRVQAEELCCATNQVVTKTKERPSEWIPLGAPILRCLPHPNRRRAEPARVTRMPFVELLFSNGYATTLPPYPLNPQDAFFQQASRLSGQYWNVNAGYRMQGKKYRAKRGPHARVFFPIIAPAGVTHKQAKDNGLLGVPIPSRVSVIFSPNRLVKLEADIQSGVRYILGKFYRREEDLTKAEDSAIFVAEERLLKLDNDKKPLCVVSERESPYLRPTKKQRREGTGRVTYVPVFTYAVALGGGEFFHPNPDFPLREDYLLPDGSLSYRDRGRRWFRTRLDAQQYCCLAFLATRDPTTSTNPFKYRPGYGDKAVLLPRVENGVQNRKQPARKKGGVEEEEGEEGEGRAEVWVHVYSERMNSKSHVPKFVTVTYETGARAIFLTNDSGCRVSGLMFLLPMPTLGGKCYESILEHRGTHAATELLVRWLDNSRSWVSIGSFEGGTDWPVLKYAKCFGLLGEPNWKRFAGMESRLPELNMPAVEI